MIRSILALSINGFREARRNRVSAVVALFALVLLLGSTLVTEVTVYTMMRVLTDFGLGTMGITLTLLAIFLSTSQLVREIERRTIFLMVSKPISRATFLIGRFAGTMLTLAALIAMMTAVLVVQVLLYAGSVRCELVAAAGMLWFELLVVVAVGFLLSAFAGQVVSAMVTTGIFVAGHLSGDIYSLSQRSASAFIRVLGKGIYYLLPNLERLSFRPNAAYEQAVAGGDVLAGIAYAAAYSAACLSLAVILFRKRDFK